MKIFVDVHLPIRLVYWLRERLRDVLYTWELPKQNETEGIDIIQSSVDQGKIVI